MSRSIVLGVFMALAASPASAQFTTFVSPPKKDSIAAAAAAVASTPAKRDSVQRVALGNMKTWVDSVAGTTGSTATVAAPLDSTTTVTTPAPAAAPRPAQTTFTNGAVAPATASMLPALALLGLAALSLGTLMLAGRPQR
ncbi:MAG: hypothetical protein JWO05_2112 [Gemmatimonadetes bacterium]|nr:hypothetical protein [Gemmatimonadota bacterium]